MFLKRRKSFSALVAQPLSDDGGIAAGLETRVSGRKKPV